MGCRDREPCSPSHHWRNTGHRLDEHSFSGQIQTGPLAVPLPIRFGPEAEAEFEAAALYYEERSVGLGVAFLETVDAAVVRLAEAPRLFSLSPGVPEELGVRRILLLKFPYSLVYVELKEEIRVLALAHGARRPGYWAERLEPQ